MDEPNVYDPSLIEEAAKELADNPGKLIAQACNVLVLIGLAVVQDCRKQKYDKREYSNDLEMSVQLLARAIQIINDREELEGHK